MPSRSFYAIMGAEKGGEVMKRILVIGCPGSGKSTLARRLQAQTGLPLFHLDMIWHLPDRTTVTQEAFDRALGEILDREEWIIDGNYMRTMERRLAACDTVFFLDLPVEVCLAGARSRIGHQREDLPWLETELDPEFEEWIRNFPSRSLPRIDALLSQLSPKVKLIILHSHEEIEAYFQAL